MSPTRCEAGLGRVQGGPQNYIRKGEGVAQKTGIELVSDLVESF